MTELAQKVLDDALTLSVDERTQIAGQLLASLDGPAEEGVEAAWNDEIRRRVEALDAGQAEVVSWEDAEAMIFGDRDGSTV